MKMIKKLLKSNQVEAVAHPGEVTITEITETTDAGKLGFSWNRTSAKGLAGVAIIHF
jgi:hypothetical protein